MFHVEHRCKIFQMLPQGKGVLEDGAQKTRLFHVKRSFVWSGRKRWLTSSVLPLCKILHFLKNVPRETFLFCAIGAIITDTITATLKHYPAICIR